MAVLTKSEQAIVDLLTQNESLTGPEICERRGISYGCMKVTICKIRKKGINIIGRRRGCHSLGYRLEIGA